MASITVAEWRKVRAGCAEGSGVAEGIKGYDAKWPKDYSRVTEKDPAAVKASEKLVKALDVALGKCNKAGPREDKKKLKETKELIAEWKTELAKQEEDLDIAVAVQQKLAAQERNEASLSTAIAENYADLARKLDETEDRIDQISTLLTTNKVEAAFKIHSQVVAALKNSEKLLTEPGFKDQFKKAATKLAIDPVGIRPDSCRPKAFKVWRQKLDVLRRAADAKEADLDRVDAGEDPDSAAGDPAYKANLKKLTGEYRAIQKLVATTIPMIGKLTTQAQQMKVSVKTLTDDRKPGALVAVRTCKSRVTRFEQNLMAQMSKIRTSDGEISAKRAQYGITTDDTTKFLAPILTQAISQNLRATRACTETTEVLNDVEEQLTAA